MRKPADHALQEKVRLDRSMLLWSIGSWLLVPICWVPVIAADSTPGEKDLGLGVLAMACVFLSFVIAIIALILTLFCLAEYVQRRRKLKS